MSIQNWFRIVLLALLWGGSYILVELALEGFRPLTLVFVRVGLAASILWAVALRQGHRAPRTWRIWSRFAIMGLLANVLPFSLISWGQQSIDAGTASILNAAVPLFTVLIAQRFSDEKITANQLLGILVGFAGVCFLMLGTLQAADLNPSRGQLAALLAAACYAAGAVYGKRLHGTAPIINAAAMLTCSAIILLPAALIVENPSAQSPGVSAWAGVIGLAIFSSALAYLLYFRVLGSAGATQLSLVTFLIPIVSPVMGAVFLNERLQTNEIIGLAVILLGVAVVNHTRKLTRFRQAIHEISRFARSSE